MSDLVRSIHNVFTVFNAKKDYGAVGNALSVTNGAITSGTNTLTSASGLFTSSDTGKRITVVGAGSAGVCLNTTMTYVSSTQVTLASNASATVTGATVWWGTRDETVLQTMATALKNAGGGIGYFPPGAYTGTGFTVTGSNIKLQGAGYSSTKLIVASSTDPFVMIDATGTGGIENICFEDFEINCLSQSSTPGIRLRGGNYATGDYIKQVTFKNCYIRNSGGSSQGGVEILSGRGTTDRGPVTDVFFIDCIFDGATQYFVYITGGQVERLHFIRPKFINSQLGCVGFNQPAKNSLTGYNGIDSDGIRSNKDWSIQDGYFSNPLATGSFIKDVNKTGVRGFDIVRNFFDVGYSGVGIYAFCIDVEGGNWGTRIKDNTFWRAYKCISLGQSNNGPWFQTNPTRFSEISGNTFYQCHDAFDHDSDCLADTHDNKFIEITNSIYYANYGRHWPSNFHDNTIYNCPTDGSGTSAALIVVPMGLELHNNTIVENRVLSNPTTAPTLSAVAGGSMGSRTYYVKYTWENDTGETQASSESNLTVGANQLLKITHPYTSTYGPPVGAKRINWYVATSSGNETKQDYTWLPWSEEYEVYPVTQQAISWTEPTSGLIVGSALPGSNTTVAITQYGIYEVSGSTMIYPNVYESNKFWGLNGGEIFSGNSAYKRIQRNNLTTRDLAFNTTPQVLEAIPYTQGNITGATTFDVWNGEVITATATGNITTTLLSGHYVGQKLKLLITQDGTGGRTISKPTNARLPGGAFNPTAAAGATDEWVLEWDGTNWVEVSRALNVS